MYIIISIKELYLFCPLLCFSYTFNQKPQQNVFYINIDYDIILLLYITKCINIPVGHKHCQGSSSASSFLLHVSQSPVTFM